MTTTETAASAPSALLRWTRFASKPYGTGAEKRSAQIHALCTAAGFVVRDMQPPATVSPWRAWPAGLPAWWRWGKRASVDRAGAGLLGYRALFYRQALAEHTGARVLLWETTYDSLLPALARAAGYRVIALPHNIEAFATVASASDAHYDVLADLAAEVTRLSAADALFTIGREERWLLETRGLAPSYLPYYPDPDLAEHDTRIREVRRRRARPDGSVSGPLLLLGSAFNPATARGMRVQLEWLRASGLPAGGAVVAGFQTETVLADALFPGVTLLGGVTPDKLEELLETCSALLLHTFGGVGAVTRIPEALVAGIPVIANSNAARDQYGTPGVHTYDDRPGFAALVARNLPLPPMPPRPAAEEAGFQATLHRLVEAGGI